MLGKVPIRCTYLGNFNVKNHDNCKTSSTTFVLYKKWNTSFIYKPKFLSEKWSKVPLMNLIVAQLIKNFKVHYCVHWKPSLTSS